MAVGWSGVCSSSGDPAGKQSGLRASVSSVPCPSCVRYGVGEQQGDEREHGRRPGVPGVVVRQREAQKTSPAKKVLLPFILCAFPGPGEGYCGKTMKMGADGAAAGDTTEHRTGGRSGPAQFSHSEKKAVCNQEVLAAPLIDNPWCSRLRFLVTVLGLCLSRSTREGSGGTGGAENVLGNHAPGGQEGIALPIADGLRIRRSAVRISLGASRNHADLPVSSQTYGLTRATRSDGFGSQKTRSDGSGCDRVVTGFVTEPMTQNPGAQRRSRRAVSWSSPSRIVQWRGGGSG